MRKLILLISFFTLTPFTILSLVFFLYFSSYQSSRVLGASIIDTNRLAYAAIPAGPNDIEAQASISDRRIQSVEDFFARYNSPLLPYAALIVEKADIYNIDYRYLPAIAMQESGLCKRIVASAPFNCWGFGIYGKKVTSFSSYEEAIDTVTRYFANKKNNGVDTLDEIGSIYNPTNHNNWKENVSTIMAQL